MAADEKNRDEEGRPRVIISDKRHSRAEEEVAAEEQSAPSPPKEAEAVNAPPADEKSQSEPELEVVEPEKAAEPAEAEKEPAATAEHESQPPLHDHAPGEAAEDIPQSAEMEQLKLIFEAGITSYLAGQVSMIINFALIYLGRAANPATGLVAVDIKKAKASIDTLEFIGAQIKGELPAAEQQQLAGIIADLKYTYLQAATGGGGEPAPPKGNGS